ncbi:MAG: hypothetical protein JWM53_2570 [bacterium]|nr:hypothetical protein [bacterium]
MRGLTFAVVCSWSALAVAELPVKHVDSIRVSVANKSQKALALHASAAGGWRLDLEGDGDSADVIDVTPGTPARTITLAVVTNTIKFDSVRFAGGHVYRVQLNGKKRSTASLVYLYPAATAAKLPKKATTQRLRFEPDEAPTDGEAIGRVDKGSL